MSAKNTPETTKIRVAIVGIGNCASSLYQGLTYSMVTPTALSAMA